MPCSVRPAPANSNTPPLPEKKLLDLRMAIINVQLVGHFSVLNNFCEALRINKENDNNIGTFLYVAAFRTVWLNIFCKSFIITDYRRKSFSNV